MLDPGYCSGRAPPRVSGRSLKPTHTKTHLIDRIPACSSVTIRQIRRVFGDDLEIVFVISPSFLEAILMSTKDIFFY